jgi:Domain of unknown function (DUF1917)
MSRYINSDVQPSQVSDETWLYAYSFEGSYPEATSNAGKWLVFISIDEVDSVWAKIQQAIIQGELGDSAKVATAKLSSLATNPDTKVICVYTYDWTDVDDVSRIRRKLRDLGITKKIPYKADADTNAGKYANRGHQRISKYYE